MDKSLSLPAFPALIHVNGSIPGILALSRYKME